MNRLITLRNVLLATVVLVAILIFSLVAVNRVSQEKQSEILVNSLIQKDTLSKSEIQHNKDVFELMAEQKAVKKSVLVLESISTWMIFVIMTILLSSFTYIVYTKFDFDRYDEQNTTQIIMGIFKTIGIMGAIILLSTSQSFSMNTSQTGVNLIKHYEGFRNKAYQDVVGVWTIGYGTTKDIKYGQYISREQGEILLKRDLIRFERYVVTRIHRNIPQDQFDALVSFTYNIGSIYGNFYKAVVTDRVEEVTFWINKYIKAGGRVYKGLVNRRRDEGRLYAGNNEVKRKFNPNFKVCYAK